MFALNIKGKKKVLRLYLQICLYYWYFSVFGKYMH